MTSTGKRLWFGPVAAFLLAAGILAIGQMTPDYSHVRQTVSELGEMGAPGRAAFTALLMLVAACLALLAVGAARTHREMGHSSITAYVIGAMAISVAGVGLFPHPHALHNVFGMSELLGYQAPLVAALACRKHANARDVAMFSAAMYSLVMLAIAVNLAVLDRSGELWFRIRPYHGIAQRFLFAAWFGWCAGYALLLMRARRGVGDSLGAVRPRGMG